jgi:nitrate reductase NapA
MPDEQYPFWLTTGRVLEHWHTGSMTRRVKQLHQAVPNAYVEIHADDARKLGITHGQVVRVVSRRGEVELPAKIDGRGKPLPGTLFVPFFDESKLINLVTLDAYCPISKQPDYKKCAVRIEKVAAKGA